MTRVRRILITLAFTATGLGATLAGSGAHAATPASSAPAGATPQAYGICVSSVYSPLLNFCAL